MRFSLQDVRKSVHRNAGILTVRFHFLQIHELNEEITRLIAYHEQCLHQPQRLFVVDEARAYIGEYRLANCLLATLSNWYRWQSRAWTDVVSGFTDNAALLALASPVQLRLQLYTYINAQYAGFLSASQRYAALQAFARQFEITVEQLEYLLLLDSEDEAILTRVSEEAPSPQDVVTLYNQWVFEVALANASSVRFEIDCTVFARLDADSEPQTPTLGLGAVIKRLCYLARRLGVYYELEYGETLSQVALPTTLLLTLYGPQEVTGAPQQYGLRLARLCRLLLGYRVVSAQPGRGKKKPNLSGAILGAEARVHFLQRAYTFTMSAELLQMLPLASGSNHYGLGANAQGVELFDSSVEQQFAEAFTALAKSRAADGWLLEREPEPLLTDKGIFIPDFALTRASRRVYVEVLGFWTPAYRERKMQKLQLLKGRYDLLLAIPNEARAAFEQINPYFPIVYYQQQISATDLLQVLRDTYDDFAERLTAIDSEQIQRHIQQVGFVPERLCYKLCNCYRRSELQQAAALLCKSSEWLHFVSGVGLYTQDWLDGFKPAFLIWLKAIETQSLSAIIVEIRSHWILLQECDGATIEMFLELFPEIAIQRNSIFDATVTVASASSSTDEKAHVSYADSAYLDHAVSVDHQTHAPHPAKVSTREPKKRTTKRVVREETITQGDLWS